ncbi:MAG: aminoglycoside phosphotransferase family protein [Actinomycetota bacterium]|nr:aminoglycoside phosphotransferase family protein [Actinomycetota bacterium]
MPVAAAPTDDELLDLLGGDGIDGEVVGLRRRPYSYATSAPLEEISVRTRNGEGPPLILKDLSRDRLIGDAAETKPDFLYEPRREIETYRRILSPLDLGPDFVAASSGGRLPHEHHWLVIAKVSGVELWQIGDPATWDAAARWLGELHARFQGRTTQLREANPHLLEHSASWFRSWCERACSALTGSDDDRGPKLIAALDRYDEVAERLASLPATLVHGEFYPSNILVEGAGSGEVEMRPVDWEMAALGPGLIDLAALVGGWDDAGRRRLLTAYRYGLEAGGGRLGVDSVVVADLSRCRLQLALQWIGWSSAWRPPREHAHDWLGEARDMTAELGLT